MSMNKFLAFRYVVFALFILLCGLTGSFAGLNLGFMTSGVVILQASAEALDIYLAAVSIVNVVFIVPVVATDLCRRGALTSRIWFELLWVSAFFLAYLGGAILSTMLIPKAVCYTGGPMKLACMTSIGLVVFAWISSSAYLIYFLTLLAYCVIHSKPNVNIWNTSIADHPRAPQSSLSAHGATESFDSRRTLTDTHIHPFNFKADTSQADSTAEKDGAPTVLPIYSQNATFAGPPTFGPSHAPGRRRGIDLGTANSRPIRGQNAGVDAINGVPAYYEETYFNDQGPHKFHQNPRDLESQNRIVDRNAYRSAEPVQGSRQAPWASANDDQTPSPAVITHAARVSQPPMSLYPAHVVATGLTTRSAKPPKRTEPDAAINDLLRAAGLNQSATSLPYMESSIGHAKESNLTSMNSEESGHARSQSVDTLGQDNTGRMEAEAGHMRSTSDAREQNRGRRSGPRHKPPPLNLSSLSNIANADKRR